MQRSPRRIAWCALCAALLSCTQVLEFDRAKVVDGVDGEDSGPSGPMQFDAAAIASAPEAGADAASPPDAAPQCSQDTECAPSELCCSGRCVAASPGAGCEACGVACSAASDTCSQRRCTCGANPACSAAAPFCIPGANGTSRCAACRGDEDCTRDGARQCVGGVCAQCDVADGNAGCANPAPICDDKTDACVACDASHACAGAMTCVGGSCYGCNDATNAGCDPNGTTPICELAGQAGVFQCGGCTGDAQCAGNPNGGQCVGGACEACDPRTGQNNAGCAPGSATPICDAMSGTCRACRQNDCGGGARMCSRSGATAGRCVGCTAHAQCAGATPFCDPADGACKPCGAVAGGNGQDNGWCAEQDGDRPICDASGRCVRCNGPGAAGGCSGANDRCVVNNNAPQNNICVDCTGAGGCQADEQCLMGSTPAMNRCVECVNDMGCSGVRNRCAPNNTCVDCLSPADCSDGDACTTDLCSGNVCSNQPLPAGGDGGCTGAAAAVGP